MQQQNEEIVSQRDYISNQNKDLSHKNSQITDSIRYAQTIQEAILPFENRLVKAFPNGYFAVYKPKDIVSGDIYWCEEIGGITFIAVIDCTGHGVSGAFMSMIATSILNDEVVKNGMKNPSDILEVLHQTLKKILNQDEKGSNQDGMDVAFCAIEEEGTTNKVTFAGAKRSLYYMIAGESELQEIKGSRRSIGGFQGNERPFENHEILLPKKSTLYLTTDGMADQHGPKGKKIGSVHIRGLLAEIAHLPMKAQKEKLEWFLSSHQKDQFQRDDITFVGVRI
ncbi:MAG: serine phosphatase RsbU (regulator of sigma subunit) [Arenicella sp.]